MQSVHLPKLKLDSEKEPAGGTIKAAIVSFEYYKFIPKSFVFHARGELNRIVHNVTAVLNNEQYKLCWENMPYAPLHEPAQVKTILDANYQGHFCLDISHATSAEEVLEFIDAMGDKLNQIHVSDRIGDQGHQVIGNGCVDFRAVIAKLRQTRYAGPLVIECNNNADTITSKRNLEALL